jgi:hypothetical protein
LSLLRRRREPTRVGAAVYVGSVWMNGEPILAVDAAAAEGWRGSERYDEILAAFQGLADLTAPIALGRAVGYALNFEFDDGTLDAFAFDDGRFLLIGIVFADWDDWPTFVEAAFAAPCETVGQLDIPSGRLALLPTTADWDELRQVEAEPKVAPKRREVADDVLLASVAPGPHELTFSYIEDEHFGLQAWHLA